MQTIHKFKLSVVDHFELHLPPSAQIIHVDAQNDQPMLWALLNPEEPTVRRRFRLAGTGHEIEEPVRHVGSFIILNGQFVGHVFEIVD